MRVQISSLNLFRSTLSFWMEMKINQYVSSENAENVEVYVHSRVWSDVTYIQEWRPHRFDIWSCHSCVGEDTSLLGCNARWERASRYFERPWWTSWTAWPLTMKALSFFKMSGTLWHIPTHIRVCVSLCVWIRKLKSLFPLICFKRHIEFVFVTYFQKNNPWKSGWYSTYSGLLA